MLIGLKAAGRQTGGFSQIDKMVDANSYTHVRHRFYATAMPSGLGSKAATAPDY